MRRSGRDRPKVVSIKKPTMRYGKQTRIVITESQKKCFNLNKCFFSSVLCCCFTGMIFFMLRRMSAGMKKTCPDAWRRILRTRCAGSDFFLCENSDNQNQDSICPMLSIVVFFITVEASQRFSTRWTSLVRSTYRM